MIEILNIMVEIIKDDKVIKRELCMNFILNKGDEIKISIMKVEEKEE